MQILKMDSEPSVHSNNAHQMQRVYSPNAAINGRRDINKELHELQVPQFYPASTTNQSAPRHFQFTQ